MKQPLNWSLLSVTNEMTRPLVTHKQKEIFAFPDALSFRILAHYPYIRGTCFLTRLLPFLGSGLLVNTITAGLVFIIRPFKMSRRPFLKDSFFYLSAVTWSASILIRRRLYYADAIGEFPISTSPEKLPY